jgi:LacI family transcriptional regulator
MQYIGLVLSYNLAYCREILRGVTRYSESRRDWVFLPVDSEAHAVRALRAVKLAGVLAHVTSPELVRALGRLECPRVNVSTVLPNPPLPQVGTDNCRVGAMAAEYFLARGFQHFAYVGHAKHRYSVEQEQGYRAALSAAGLKCHSYHSHDTTSFQARGRLWSLGVPLQRWLLSLPKPTAIMACNDLWGLQLTEACRQVELRVPEEVAIVGVDNDDLFCEMSRPALSSIALPAEQVGYESARLLDELISSRRGGASAISKQLAPLGVVTRRSSDTWAMDDADVAVAARFIHEHADRPLLVSDVASHVAVARRTLERRFSACVGRTVWEEIRRAHMDRAKQLLAQTRLPIARIAVLSGFSGSRHLANAFRLELGTTASTFRRRAASQE